jgi:hypothetical protein
MLAHPSDKNKDVARVGHPQFSIDSVIGSQENSLVSDLL